MAKIFRIKWMRTLGDLIWTRNIYFVGTDRFNIYVEIILGEELRFPEEKLGAGRCTRHSYGKTIEVTDVSLSRVPSARPGPTQRVSVQVRTLYRHLIKNSSPHPCFMSMHWRNAPRTLDLPKNKATLLSRNINDQLRN